MLEIDYSENISGDAWGGILSNPMFIRADSLALHSTPTVKLSRRQELEQATQAFLAKGGKIEVVPEGKCKDVVYFNFENPGIARVQQERRDASMSRRDEAMCARLDALLEVEQALTKDELCRALNCARSRLDRVLNTYYKNDARAEYYRADTKVVKENARYAEYRRKILAAIEAGAKNNIEVYTACGMSEKTFYRIVKRMELKLWNS